MYLTLYYIVERTGPIVCFHIVPKNERALCAVDVDVSPKQLNIKWYLVDFETG